MGYVSLVQKLETELGYELTDLDRTDLWTRARVDEEVLTFVWSIHSTH